MDRSSRTLPGKLAILYVIALHGLLVVVLWKSDFIPRVTRRISTLHARTQGPEEVPQPLYETLLARFPEDQQGAGVDEYDATSLSAQPMTYGLILSAESKRFRDKPTPEGKRRIHKAFSWLLENSDLDADGRAGWGLPQPWDAFGDGSINPANHPYTVTTAICLNAMLDALTLDDIWDTSEEDAARRLLVEISVDWSRQYVSKGFGGKYFWYSITPSDDYFCPNVSSMFMGSLARLLREHPEFFNDEQFSTLEVTVTECAQAIVSAVEMRYGAPFWKYIASTERTGRTKANDAVHHAYILWGIETYRDCYGIDSIPWSREQSLESMDRFWSQDRCFEFPQDEKNSDEAARLWGVGMALALYGRFGSVDKADRILQCIARDYRWPELTHRPGEESPFLPRSAAHVLFGMACMKNIPTEQAGMSDFVAQ